MNADALTAAFEANKPVVLGVAAAGVAGLALYRKKKTPAAAAKTAAAGGTSGVPPTPVYSTGGQTAAYDSSASDVYSALQPQLESVGTAQNQLTGQQSQLLTLLQQQQELLNTINGGVGGLGTGIKDANQSLANLGSLDTNIYNQTQVNGVALRDANQSLANLGSLDTNIYNAVRR